MKNTIYLVFVLIIFLSCNKQAEDPILPALPSKAELEKISKLGFDNSNVVVYRYGFLIENDIYIDRDSLDKINPVSIALRIAQSEQYRTFNVVKVPRTVSISGELLGNKLDAALDTMINRYNKLNTNLKFRRTASNGFIRLFPRYDLGKTTIASAGFPNSIGDPYTSILINMNFLNSFNPQQWGQVLQHEVGHCIGFRHTDYMNRAFSCGTGGNEGQAIVGAILIPGTPAEPNEGSFMLSCFSDNGIRAFNPNDIIAMRFLFK